MAGKTLTVYLAADLKKFTGPLNTAKSQLGLFEGGLGGVSNKLASAVGPALLTAGAAAGAFAVKMGVDGVKAASDLSEAMNKASVIFGTSAAEIFKFAETANTSLGQTEQQAIDAASTFAQFGKAAGLAGSDLTRFSTDLVTLSADLASFNNASPEETILAIGAALRGESEPIRKYGVMLNDATLKAKALEMGLYNGKGALDAKSKSLAAQAVILDQTRDAQGDFARTSDGLANTTRIVQASVQDLTTALGKGLMRGMGDTSRESGKLVDALQDLKPLMEDIGEEVGYWISDLAYLTRLVIGAKTAFDNWAASLSGPMMVAVNGVINATTSMLNPIGNLVKALGFAQEAVGIELPRASDAARASTTALDRAISSGQVPWQARLAAVDYTTEATNQNTDSTDRNTRSVGGSTAAVQKLTKEQQNLIDSMSTKADAVDQAASKLDTYTKAVDDAAASIEEYVKTTAQSIADTFDLTGVFEQAMAAGGDFGGVLKAGIEAEAAETEWTGNVLAAIQREGSEELKNYLVKIGGENAAAWGQALIDNGLVKYMADSLQSVVATAENTAKAMVPPWMVEGLNAAIGMLSEFAKGMDDGKKDLAKLGKKAGAVVGKNMSAQIAEDIAQAIKAAEAAGAAARAEAVAAEERRQAALTQQALANVVAQVINNANARTGYNAKPVVV